MKPADPKTIQAIRQARRERLASVYWARAYLMTLSDPSKSQAEHYPALLANREVS